MNLILWTILHIWTVIAIWSLLFLQGELCEVWQMSPSDVTSVSVGWDWRQQVYKWGGGREEWLHQTSVAHCSSLLEARSSRLHWPPLAYHRQISCFVDKVGIMFWQAEECRDGVSDSILILFLESKKWVWCLICAVLINSVIKDQYKPPREYLITCNLACFLTSE